MCQLAKLDLFLCSESIETVSISGEYRLCTSGESKSTFLVKYSKRDTPHSSEMSPHKYFHFVKNSLPTKSSGHWKSIIPHYVGASSTPTYPVKVGYAKSVLILHVPWKNTFNEEGHPRNYIDEFERFLTTKACPLSVKVGYNRAKTRYEQNTQFVEPTGRNKTICYESFSTNIDDTIQEIVALASTLGLTCTSNIQDDNEYFYVDESTDWSHQHYKV